MPTKPVLPVVLMTLGLAAALPGAAAASQRLPSLQKQRVMLGQVYLDRPIASASVRLYTLKGKALPAGAYTARTSRDGFFTIKPRQLPSSFRVVVTGGRDGKRRLNGKLMTAVSKYKGMTNIGVSGATTLIAAYAKRHPRLSLTRAAGRVTNYLKLPVGYGSGSGLRYDNTSFSEARFVSRAKAAGGIDKYVGKVIRLIDRGKPVASFAPPRPLAGPIGNVLEGINAVVKIWKFSQCQAKKDKFDPGCVVEAFSSGGDGQAQLEALAGIHDQLVGILDQISQLQAQLTDSINGLRNSTLQTQWNNVITTFQNTFYGPIGAAYTNLMSATDPSYTETDRKNSAMTAKNIIRKLSENGADVTMSKDLLPQAGATGALAQWSDLVRAQAGRFFASSSKYYSGGYAPLIQQEWQFFADWQAKLEYVLIEGANAAGNSKLYIDEQIIQPYLGVPVGEQSGGQLIPVPADKKRQVPCSEKPVTATASCLGWFDQELAAVGNPLAENTVIDIKTGLMWSQWMFNYRSEDGPDSPLPLGGRSWADAVLGTMNGGDFSDWGGFKNWRLPTSGELQSLFAGNTDVPGLRDRLSGAGFFNNPPGWGSHQDLNRLGGAAQDVWTSTPQGGQYAFGQLATGQMTTGAGPASVLAVRELSPCERYYYDTSKAPPPPCS